MDAGEHFDAYHTPFVVDFHSVQQLRSSAQLHDDIIGDTGMLALLVVINIPSLMGLPLVAKFDTSQRTNGCGQYHPGA